MEVNWEEINSEHLITFGELYSNTVHLSGSEITISTDISQQLLQSKQTVHSSKQHKVTVHHKRFIIKRHFQPLSASRAEYWQQAETKYK